jgi:MATE family multidrug resistance protein
MLQAGAVGSGMTSIKFAAHQRSQLGGVQRRNRDNIVAAAHGVRPSDPRAVNDFLSTRGQEAFAMYGLESVRSTGGFIGASSMGEGTALINTSGSLRGGICGPCRLCCSKVRRKQQPADDTMQEGLITSANLGGAYSSETEATEEESGEWTLLLSLAMPLLGGKLADNVSTIGMQTLWGNLGTVALAAGNLATSYQYLTLAFIYGAQQAIYSMVPQATGAGNNKQVGAQLNMFMLWTCVYMGVPTTILWWFMGPLLADLGLEEGGYGYGYGAGSDGGPVEIDDKVIDDFSKASATWVILWTAGATVSYWLECLEIVSTVSAIAAFWTIVRVPLAWLLMYHKGVGQALGTYMTLDGYAYAYALSCAGQLFMIIGVVFACTKEPTGGRKGNGEKYWFGLDISGGLNPKLNARFMCLTAPQVIQYFLDAASSTWYYTKMSTYGAEQVGAYGVADALTGTGGCIALALYTATSIRVGTTLGENNPERAQTAAFAGISYAGLCGVIMASLLYFLRNDLAYLFSPLDENVRYLICTNIFPVVGFYFLSALQYGLWAVLEGQMRIAETGICIGIGTWCVGIPLMHAFMPEMIQDANGQMVFPERGDCFPTAIDWQVGYADTVDDGIAMCEFNPTGDDINSGKTADCPPPAFLECLKDPNPFVSCEETCPRSSGCQFTPAYMVPPKDKIYCNAYMKNATWGSTLCEDDDNCSYSAPNSPMYIMWCCQCAALVAGNTLMLICIVTANWEKLAKLAVEYAEQEEEEIEQEMKSRAMASGDVVTGADASDGQDNRHGGILASAPPEDDEEDGVEDRDDP